MKPTGTLMQCFGGTDQMHRGQKLSFKSCVTGEYKKPERMQCDFQITGWTSSFSCYRSLSFFPLINSKIYLRRATELFWGFGPKSLGTNRMCVGNRRWLSHTSGSKLSFHKHNVNPSVSWQRWICWALRWRMLGLWGRRLLYPLLKSINFRKFFSNILLWVSGEAESWNQTIRTVSNKNCGSFAGHKFLNTVLVSMI